MGRTGRALVAVVVALGALVVPGPVPASAAPPPAIERIAGADRYDTAARIARAAFPAGADTVVLVSGTGFPDALSASGLAGHLDAPILLTRPDALPAATAAALEDLDPASVVVIGSSATVSNAVTSAIIGSGRAVTRIGGSNRYHTAALVAQEIGASSTVFLVNGRNYPDGLAVSPGAHAGSIPVLLTDPVSLSSETAQAIAATGADRVVIAGGFPSVSQAIETALVDDGLAVVRLAGPNRYSTSVAVADWLVDNLGVGTDNAYVATGQNFPDALAGGPLASRGSGALVLTPSLALGADADGFLSARQPQTIFLLGGLPSLSAQVGTDAVVAATGATAQSLDVTPRSAANLEVAAEPSTADDRTYTVSGLDDLERYDLVLVDASNVDDESLADLDVDGIADPHLSAAAVIDSVNGSPVAPAPMMSDVAPDAGTLTFVIDGADTGSLVPLVVLDDGDDDVEVDGNGIPTSPFGIGGVTAFAPAPAVTALDGPDGRVVAISKSAASGTLWLDTSEIGPGPFDAADADVAISFDFNDDLSVGGVGVSAEEFADVASRGDHVIVGSYAGTAAGVSVIDLDADVPGSPTVSATASGDDVTVTVAAADIVDETAYDSFVVQRAADVGGDPGAFVTIGVVDGDHDDDIGAGEMQIRDANRPTGSWWYRVAAVLDGQQSEFGIVSVPVATVADVVGPTTLARGAVQDVDAGFTDVVDAGDVFVLHLDEAVVLDTASLIISDGTDSGVLVDGVNATFALNPARRGAFGTGQILTVTVTDELTGVGAASYTITNRSGIGDDSGNSLQLAGDLTLEDDGPEMVAAVAVDAATVLVHFNEPLSAGSISTGDFAFDVDGTGPGGSVPPTAVEVSVDGSTVTLTVAAASTGVSQVAVVQAVDDTDSQSTAVQAKLTLV